MRDILFILVFAVLLYFSFKRCYISLSLWVWSGLFVPVNWLYGIAQSFSYNTAFSAVTIGTYLYSKNKNEIHLTLSFALVLLFFLHTCITSYFSLTPYMFVVDELVQFFKSILLLVMICLIVRDKHEFEMLIWAMILSIGFYGYVEALKFISSGGAHNISGPRGSNLSDNNHIAVVLCATMPFLIYISNNTSLIRLRGLLLFSLILIVLAIIGTHSRGGFLGLIIVGAYFWIKSNYKIYTLFGLLLIIFVVYNFLTLDWIDRMNTINEAGQDSSFMNRIVSWKIHLLLALEHPFLGGGFKSGSFGFVWREMALNFDKLSFIPSSLPSGSVLAAHSIYFQVLGDHGFVGLFLFISIIISCYMRLGHISRYEKYNDDNLKWRGQLAKMIQLSFVAYSTAGAAVSLAYLEFFWVIIAISISLDLSTRYYVSSRESGYG